MIVTNGWPDNLCADPLSSGFPASYVSLITTLERTDPFVILTAIFIAVSWQLELLRNKTLEGHQPDKQTLAPDHHTLARRYVINWKIRSAHHEPPRQSRSMAC